MLEKSIRRQIIEFTESLLRHICFWATTEEEFGNCLIGLHIGLVAAVWISVIVVQLFDLPNIIIFAMIVMFMCLFLQHYLLGLCVLSSIENRVLGAPYPITEPFLKVFTIPVSVDSVRGVNFLVMTIFIAVFGLQLLRRFINFKK
jgi:hypothetical protein